MKKFFLFIIIVIISACSNNEKQADGYGNFEAIETIISSEANGKIYDLRVMEGDAIKAGDTICVIDTVQLHLKKIQLLSSIEAVRSKTKDVQVQINVLLEQKSNILRDKDRIERLFKDSAATQKQVDDINGQLAVVERNISATKSNLSSGNAGMLAEIKPLEVQIEQINDNIKKSIILAPSSGTILTKFVENGELVNFGKAICKIADIENIYLRAYVSGSQLSKVKIGDKVKVLIDKDAQNMAEYEGEVSWISSKAEFTPKIIQTKEERVNLVYAVKVLVKNDGSIKIGMPGEMKLK
ncbi:MAG TPA: HlyD family efflux transporter periplasmic adaptor subunit [Candidatus Kapabacteria bacterium]|nr:HlyD family efflux transporter periplasmic adaptor subunit [Candidatus Kapabacteria bacterium]HPO63871.1 HlyD family efflux transporter periplasmic adaptor subunit [Candidatus Kapabacteria bacterium]